MKPYFFSVCLLAGALLPVAAHAGANGPSNSKGAKSVPPARTTSDTAPGSKMVAKTITPRTIVVPDAHPDSFFQISPRGFRTAYATGTVAAVNDGGRTLTGGRLARVTAYWPSEGDYYTRHNLAATGVRLHDGHCAVDPAIIPYGSVVEIAGVGKFLAVDTGSAVVSRTAAREGGHTTAERAALVVDLFFENRAAGEAFAASDAKFITISWWTPGSTGSQARLARSLFAEEDWSMIQSKQL